MLQAFQTAGYRVDGDAVVVELGPGVELRANGIEHLLEMCAAQKADPLQVLAAIVTNARNQQSVQKAIGSSGKIKGTINIDLKAAQLQGGKA
jgi:hypothetical protein